jgi:hypothetical protein
VSRRLQTFLLNMANGSLAPEAGYNLISLTLGLPAKVVRDSFPIGVDPQQKQQEQQAQQQRAGGVVANTPNLSTGQEREVASGVERDTDSYSGDDDTEDESTQQLREAWKESDHPRDDNGKFTSGADIEAAKNDSAKAKELRDKTTDPKQRAKLDKLLGDTSTSDETNIKADEVKQIRLNHGVTTPKDSPIRKLKSGTALTADSIHELMKDDPRTTGEILSDIARRTAYDVGKVQTHGMTKAVNMKQITFNGMKIRIETTMFDEAGKEGILGRTLAELIYPDAMSIDTHRVNKPLPLPPALVASTQMIVLTKQKNVQDEIWEKAYNMKNFESAATGGDGTITVYNLSKASRTHRLDRSIFAHEAGHNLATQLWGTTAPLPTSEYGKVQDIEPPVTPYGANSASEDFAEAVNLFVTKREYLENNFPEKYIEIKKLLEG